MKITIEVAQEVELTTDEYRQRVGILEMPKFALGVIVEYRGEYKQPKYAMVSGYDLRAGGWMYSGKQLQRNAVSTVSFSESDIIESKDTPPTTDSSKGE